MRSAYFCVAIETKDDGSLEVVGASFFSERPEQLTREGHRINWACLYEATGRTFQEALDWAHKALPMYRCFDPFIEMAKRDGRW